VQLQADQTTIKNKTPNIPHYLCTVYPDSTGAWNLADGSDQTVSGHLAELIAYNTWIRSGGAVAAGFAGYFEVADFNEMAPRNSGKWKADGTTSKYTSDGLHGSTFATTGITLTPLW
jgi:hypothetical protein